MVVPIWSGPLTRIGLTIRFPTFRRVSACQPDSGIGRPAPSWSLSFSQGGPCQNLAGRLKLFEISGIGMSGPIALTGQTKWGRPSETGPTFLQEEEGDWRIVVLASPVPETLINVRGQPPALRQRSINLRTLLAPRESTDGQLPTAMWLPATAGFQNLLQTKPWRKGQTPPASRAPA